MENFHSPGSDAYHIQLGDLVYFGKPEMNAVGILNSPEYKNSINNNDLKINVGVNGNTLDTIGNTEGHQNWYNNYKDINEYNKKKF